MSTPLAKSDTQITFTVLLRSHFPTNLVSVFNFPCRGYKRVGKVFQVSPQSAVIRFPVQESSHTDCTHRKWVQQADRQALTQTHNIHGHTQTGKLQLPERASVGVCPPINRQSIQLDRLRERDTFVAEEVKGTDKWPQVPLVRAKDDYHLVTGVNSSWWSSLRLSGAKESRKLRQRSSREFARG